MSALGKLNGVGAFFALLLLVVWAVALAVLLQTWNRPFYQYRRFDSQHFSDIEQLLDKHGQAVLSFRGRKIETWCDEDEGKVRDGFRDSETVLGPVGAAKCLHLLALEFFPLWDRAIAEAYGFPLLPKGQNAEACCQLAAIVREQCKRLAAGLPAGRNPLKALDAYNYCKCSKGWL